MIDISIGTYRMLWIVWVLYFGVVETLALVDTKGHGGTLSYMIRWIRDQHPYLLALGIGATITWLFVHFLLEDNVVRSNL